MYWYAMYWPIGVVHDGDMFGNQTLAEWRHTQLE